MIHSSHLAALGAPHPRVRRIGWFGSDIVDAVGSAISDAADAVVSVVHLVPGVDWLGDQLKDFSHTTGGKWFIAILATAATSGLYAGTEATLSAYTALAPQVASIVFAFPQMANGNKNFFSAWSQELISRVERTANIAGPQFAAALTAAIQPAVSAILDSQAIQDAINAGKDLQEINRELKQYGVPDVTEYATRKAIDLVHQTNDAAQEYFDQYGNQTDGDGGAVITGATADQKELQKMQSLNMSVAAYNQALAVQKATTLYMPRAGNTFLDEVDAVLAPAPASVIVETSSKSAPKSLIAGVSNSKLAIGGGVSLLAAYLIVRFL